MRSAFGKSSNTFETARLVILPVCVLTAAAWPASIAANFSTLREANWRAYGNVELQRAWLEVRLTAPGILATQ